MSIEFEPMHVRPMTERPDRDFHYVFINGVKSPSYYVYQFDLNFLNARGWVPTTFTPKPPQPKDGEWWMCNYKSPEFETKVVLNYRNGNFYNTEKSHNDWNQMHITLLYKMERAEG